MTALTVREVMEQLERYNPDALVHMAYQIEYPLHRGIGGIAPGDEDGKLPQPLDGEAIRDEDLAKAEHVYLTESDLTSGGYASRELWHASTALDEDGYYYPDDDEEVHLKGEGV